MVPQEGRMIGMQQDTTRSAGSVDTLVGQKADTVRQKTTPVKTKPAGVPLEDLENLFLQADKRLQKDSVTAATKKRTVVKAKKVKKVLQEPADSIFVMEVTAQPPDNGALSLISRAFSSRELLTADSTRIYRPIVRKNQHPLKTHTYVRETQEPGIVAVKRAPAYLRENWILGALLIIFLLITWTRIRFGKLLNQTLSGIWNYKNANALYRNKSSLYQWTSVILTFNYFFTFSLFLYLFLKAFYPEVFAGGISHLEIWFYLMAGVAAVYFYLLLIIRVTGFIALAEEPMKEFSAFTVLFFHTIGLYLFPVIAIVPYVYEPVAKQLLWLGMLVVALLYLFRVVKLITVFLRERFSIFLMILYLCTLEILPVAIFLKIISE